MRKFLVSLIGLLLSTSMYSQVIEDGTYYMLSKHSGNCVALESSKDKAKVEQSVCEDIASQKFYFTHISDDYYTISNLTVGQDSDTNGAHIYNSDQGDEFKIEQIDTSYTIKSKNSGKYITAKPYTNEVIQYFGHADKEQLWAITENIVNSVEPTYIYSKGDAPYIDDTLLWGNNKTIIAWIENYEYSADFVSIIGWGAHNDGMQIYQGHPILHMSYASNIYATSIDVDSGKHMLVMTYTGGIISNTSGQIFFDGIKVDNALPSSRGKVNDMSGSGIIGGQAIVDTARAQISADIISVEVIDGILTAQEISDLYAQGAQ